MKSIELDMAQWVDEIDNRKNENLFDDTIANAIANENVSTQIKKNS